MIETEQENKEATEDIESDGDDYDSDEDDSDYIETNKCREKYSIFEDEEESDDPGMQNTLGKESGHEKIVGIDNQDAVATDNGTTESGKADTHDASNKSDHESATTNKTDAAGNNKRAGDDNLEVEKGEKAKKAALERDNDGVKYRIITRKWGEKFIHRICLFVIKIFRL